MRCYSGTIFIGLAFLTGGCAGATGGTVGGDGTTFAVVTGDGETVMVERNPTIQVDQSIQVSPAQAWNVLPDVFEELGMEVNHYISNSRQIGTRDFRMSGQFLNRRASDFVDCGHDPGLMRPLADQATVRLSVTTSVLERGDGSAALRTQVEGSARSAVGAGTANCRSTGVMENLIAQLTDRLAVIDMIDPGID